MIYLLSCSAIKGRTSAPAGVLYTSDLFRKASEYLSRLEASWLILSAEHGAISPDRVIAPYETSLLAFRAAEKRAWAESVVSSLPKGDYTVFAGRAYADPLRDAGLAFLDPLKGLELGDRKAWFSKRLRELDGKDW